MCLDFTSAYSWRRTMIARIVALGLMSAAAAVSQAGTSASDEVPTVQVHYADLDLSTEHGALTLYKRIEGAARRVCPSASSLNIRASQLSARCVSTAIERAVADVNSPQLAKVGAVRARRLSQG
jgi:UrcA family protein